MADHIHTEDHWDCQSCGKRFVREDLSAAMKRSSVQRTAMKGLSVQNTVSFKRLDKANNGQWMLEYSVNNCDSIRWLENDEAMLILSAQRAARDEIRSKIKDLMLYEGGH